MNSVFVRTAALADLPVIRDLLGETWHDTYDPIYGAARVAEITASWHSTEVLKPRLTRPNSEFLVADDGTRLCGFAFAAAATGKKLVVLHQLYIRSAFQRRGIGSNLLREVEASFPDADCVRLEVDSGNASSIAFYRSRGFTLVERTESDGPGDPNMPAQVFEKRLG